MSLFLYGGQNHNFVYDYEGIPGAVIKNHRRWSCIRPFPSIGSRIHLWLRQTREESAHMERDMKPVNGRLDNVNTISLLLSSICAYLFA